MAYPQPIDNEIKLNQKRYIVSKTDAKGFIEYGNDYFVKISCYTEAELIGKPHSILRHPDMPIIVFKMIWDCINRAQNIMAVAKNLAKDGGMEASEKYLHGYLEDKGVTYDEFIDSLVGNKGLFTLMKNLFS